MEKDRYSLTVDRIFNRTKSVEFFPHLHLMEKLCAHYKNPQDCFKSIHVAGTNGKGSVCTKIAAALQSEGYRVGLYTSPHISSFRERIRIDEDLISEEEICSLFEDVNAKLESLNLTASFFEITTMLAFLYFQKKQVDFAVVETGLGGRLDATNVILPLVSVITSIGYDHMNILGNSLEEIALEKAGIIKDGVPVVLGRDASQKILYDTAHQKNCLLVQSRLKDMDYDRENQETARLALTMVQSRHSLSERAIQAGLEKRPPCRFEKHQKSKPVVLDVAHNAHGFERLLEKLHATYPNHLLRFVVGFSRGKDVSACAELLQNHASAIHVVSGEHPRLAQVSEIAPTFNPSKVVLHLEKSIPEGIQHALLATCESSEVIVITGSFFIMAEARTSLGIIETKDSIIWYDALTQTKYG